MKTTKLFRSVMSVTALAILFWCLPAAVSANETSGSSNQDKFCSTFVQIESVLSSSIPLLVMAPKDAKRVAEEQLNLVEPLYASAQKLASDDISTAVDTMATTMLHALSTLDFSETRTPEFANADDAIDTKLRSDCDFEELPVTAVDYEYQGIPEMVPAGETALTLLNKGSEVHEISIARINDDIDLSAKEILALPEKESLAAITLVGYIAVPPGGTATTFVNLPDGRYYAVCFTPEGTKSLHTSGQGRPHVLRGMLKEFIAGTGAQTTSSNNASDPSLRSSPEKLLSLLGKYIAAKDVDAVMDIHEPDAGLVEWAGGVARGPKAVRQAYVDFFARDPDLRVNARQIVEAGGVAIILGDYTLDFLGGDGETISTSGKFGDIVRQQPDGSWLYLLDNPYAP